MINTKHLRTLAEAATPGPWADKGVSRSCMLDHKHAAGKCIYDNVTFYEDDHVITQAVAPFTEVAGNYDYEEGGIIKRADQLYIAACSPDVVLALLDALERKDNLLREQLTICKYLSRSICMTDETGADTNPDNIVDSSIEAITKEIGT